MSNINRRQLGQVRQQARVNLDTAKRYNVAENRAASARALYDRQANAMVQAGNRLGSVRDKQWEKLQDVEGEMIYLRGLVRLIQKEYVVKAQQRAALMRVIGRLREAQLRALRARTVLAQREKLAMAASRLMSFAKMNKAQNVYNNTQQVPYSAKSKRL